MEEKTMAPEATTQLVKREPANLAPTSLSEAMAAAKLIAASELCPKDYRDKPQDVLIAIMAGNEVGISPFASVQNIAVINGRATMWGDVVLGLVRQSGLLVSIKERDPEDAWVEREGRCEVLRKGDTEPTVRVFTYERAEAAGLVKRSGPSGPWTNYPGRMLQMRARSWALRDTFPDVLKGLQIREEVEDYQDDTSPTVAMPRRLSTSAGGEEVDRFLAEGQKPRSAPAASQRPQATAKPSNGHPETWRGTIKTVTKKEGGTPDKPWTLYKIHGEDGTVLSTFDDPLAEEAFQLKGMEAEIVYKTDAKGYKNAESVQAVSGDAAE